MVFSNWRGAICRGTLLVLLAWAGLAWTQTPTQPPAGAERFVYVHENGQKTRCRVLESWQLPDGRMAHLLETVETKEKITIVDEPAPAGEGGLRGWARQKRIFSWGLGRSTPPEGAPLPPHLRLDSGIVINNDTPPPAGAVAQAGPVILNQTGNDEIRNTDAGAPMPINLEPTPGSTIVKTPTDFEPAKKQPVQIIDFQNPPAGAQGAGGSAPLIVNQAPTGANGNTTSPATPQDLVAPKRAPLFPRINAFLAKPFGDQGCDSTPSLPRTGGNLPAVASAGGAKPALWQGPDAASAPSGVASLPPAVLTAPTGVSPPVAISQPPVEVAPPQVVCPTPSAVPPAPVAISQPPMEVASPQVVCPTPPVKAPAPVVIAPVPVAISQPPVEVASPQVVCPTPRGEAPAPLAIAPPPAPIGNAPAPSVAPPAPIGMAPSSMGVAAPPATMLPTPVPDQGGSNPAMPPPAPAESNAPVADPNQAPASKPADPNMKRSWRPGDLLFGWMHKPAATPAPAPTETQPDFVKPPEPAPLLDDNDVLATENKLAEKRINDKMAGLPKAPISTAVAQGPSVPPNPPEVKKPEVAPLAIADVKPAPEEKAANLPAPPLPKDEVKPAPAPSVAQRDMWGQGTNDKVMPPGRTLLDPAALKPDIVKLPPAPAARPDDPLTAPERFNPSDDKLKPKGIAVLPPAPKAPAEGDASQKAKMLPPAGAPPSPMILGAGPYGMPPPNGWPLGTQSVMAARSGLQAPVAFVPYPVVTVPAPNHPPMPPPPQMPDAPQLNAYVNAFTPPPPPKGPAPTAGSVPPWMQPNPAMQQQAAMQQQMMQQQMMQQQMMAQGYRPYPMNPYFPYNQPPLWSQGPMTNYARNYQGPMPPNPYGAAPAMASGYAPAGYAPPMAPGYAPVGYAPPASASAPASYGQPAAAGYVPASYAPPMMPQQPMVQPVSFQQVPPQQAMVAQQVEQLVKVMRESPYPAQRQWAAQSLTSFDWRVHPQIVPALLQSASQDPAAGVRADSVACLGRMQASVEPVFGTLHAMRNDIDPRVRQAVEQAFVNLGQAPIAPQ